MQAKYYILIYITIISQCSGNIANNIKPVNSTLLYGETDIIIDLSKKLKN